MELDRDVVEKGLVIGSRIVENNSKYAYKRYLYPGLSKSIENRHSITILVGLRGTGKTVLVSQVLSGKNYAYLPMDYTPLKSQPLYDMLEYIHVSKGAEYIALDEFQESLQFDEIKAFYEAYKGEVSLVLTGSAALAFYPRELARRVERLTLEPLSFREFLALSRGIEEKRTTLDRILSGRWRHLLHYSQFIPDYMANALPYLLQFKSDIFELLKKFLRDDLITFRKLDMENIVEIEKTLYAIAISSEQISLTGLSQRIGVAKSQLHRYIELLKDGLVLKEVLPKGGKVHKEKKLYLTPPIRAGILKSIGKPFNVGILREEFFVQHTLNLGLEFDPKTTADFYLAGDTYEIGGPGKTWEQGSDYLVVDGKLPGKGELPLVAFGFLY